MLIKNVVFSLGLAFAKKHRCKVTKADGKGVSGGFHEFLSRLQNREKAVFAHRRHGQAGISGPCPACFLVAASGFFSRTIIPNNLQKLVPIIIIVSNHTKLSYTMMSLLFAASGLVCLGR